MASDDAPHRIFLLSPASCSGRRAELLHRPQAAFDLAVRVRSRAGAPLGDVFSFLSGLYFRGKLTYARRYARPPEGAAGVLVITPASGLVDPSESVRLAHLKRWAAVDVGLDEPRYLRPLARDLGSLASTLPESCEVVLLGSIATDKYLAPLRGALGGRVRFPAEFAGRGDMSRGGLLLRRAADGAELTLVAPGEAPRHGAPPPRLVPRPGILLDAERGGSPANRADSAAERGARGGGRVARDRDPP